MEFVGWAGTILVVVAYGPQMHHLWAERCAWGISLWMWAIWLAASGLLLFYSISRGDTLFIVVQSLNIAAIVATIVLALRSDRTCSYHLNRSLGCGMDNFP